MNKKVALVFGVIFLFLYILNYLQPLCPGDDYVYSFIWRNKSIYSPLPAEVIRVSSWHDLWESQWSHYMTWSGRVVSHVLAQLFLWWGKDVFNFFNALAGVVLIAEIYWCIYRGNIAEDFEVGTICWIFFVFWSFSPGFGPIYLWLTGSCNYLWTNILLLLFLIPFIHKYYFPIVKTTNEIVFNVYIFFVGVFAGCTNENSVCWIIAILALFIYWCIKKSVTEEWMYIGFIGILIGYSLLLFAPGNMERLYAEQNGANWVTAKVIKEHLIIFIMILFCQIFLWYFALRSLVILRKINIQKLKIKQDILLVKILCVLAFGMTAIMILSPGFPLRSGFSGTIYLTFATGILLRLQKENEIELIQVQAKRFLFCISVIYFIVSSTTTLLIMSEVKEDMKNIILSAKKIHSENREQILEVKPYRVKSNIEELMSGLHVPDTEFSENKENWINVAFSRYYGIKGIRMVKVENVDKETK